MRSCDALSDCYRHTHCSVRRVQPTLRLHSLYSHALMCHSPGKYITCLACRQLPQLCFCPTPSAAVAACWRYPACMIAKLCPDKEPLSRMHSAWLQPHMAPSRSCSSVPPDKICTSRLHATLSVATTGIPCLDIFASLSALLSTPNLLRLVVLAGHATDAVYGHLEGYPAVFRPGTVRAGAADHTAAAASGALGQDYGVCDPRPLNSYRIGLHLC